MRPNRLAVIATASVACGFIGVASGRGEPTTQPTSYAEATVARGPAFIPRHPTLVPGTSVVGSLLVRELGRQAVVIAAQRAGVAVIDQTLTPHVTEGAHPPTTAPSERVLDVVSRLYDGKPYECIVSVGSMTLDQLIVSADPDPATKMPPYKLLAERQAAQIDAKYVPSIQQQFGGRAPLPFDPIGDVPDDVETMLAQPDAIAAFHAARLTLASIDAHGESPARLSALARAYANLGESTRCLLDGQFDVYFARALLYAQRLAVLAPADARAAWTQAYVDALVGLNVDARAAVARAMDGGVDQPEWTDLVKPLVDEDADALDHIVQQTPALAALAAHGRARVLAYSAVDQPVWAAAIQAYRRDPADLRAMLIADDRVNLSIAGDLDVRMPAAMDAAFRRVGTWPDLPASLQAIFAREAASGAAAPLALRDALDRSIADDPSSLPWAALAEWSRQTALVLAERDLRYQVDILGVGCDEELRTWWPQIEFSPWAPILATYAHEVPAETIQALDTEDEHYSAAAIAARLRRKTKVRLHPEGEARTDRCYWQSDRTAIDQADNLLDGRESSDSAWRSAAAHRLRALSPNSLLATEQLIRVAWPEMKDQLADLRRLAQSQPDIALALTDRFVDNGDVAMAEQFAADAADRMPLQELFSNLAWTRRRQGDYAGEVKAFEDSIAKTPNLGLMHAAAEVAIATAWLRAGHPHRALPHADAAADSYMAEGLLVQAETYSRLGRLAEADKIRLAMIERYGKAHELNAFCDGLLFGYPAGNGIDARFREQAKEWEHSPREADRDTVLYIAAADGDQVAEERMLLEQCKDESRYVGQFSSLARLQLWQKRVDDARAQLTHQMHTTLQTRNAAFQRGIAKLALDILDGKPPPSPADRALVELQWSVTDRARSDAANLLGACCEQAGQRDTAIAWYRLSARVSSTGADRLVAVKRLQTLGVDPFAEEP